MSSTTSSQMTPAMVRACRQLDGRFGCMYVQRKGHTTAQVMYEANRAVLSGTVVTRQVLSRLVRDGYLAKVDWAHLIPGCVAAWVRTGKAVQA